MYRIFLLNFAPKSILFVCVDVVVLLHDPQRRESKELHAAVAQQIMARARMQWDDASDRSPDDDSNAHSISFDSFSDDSEDGSGDGSEAGGLLHRKHHHHHHRHHRDDEDN